jgi:Zn-dependent protease
MASLSLEEQERERRLRNLRAVAQHLTQGPSEQAAAAAPSAADRAAALKRWGPLAVPILFLAGKLKWLLAMCKLVKMGTLLSMFVMVWIYATMWGVPFAVGFVLLIFVHEMGHAIVMRQQGIPAGAPVFIPFVGAVIAMRGRPRNAYVEALVGIGGPLLGTLGATVCLAVAMATGGTFWYALASTGFFINLFNLIPIHPLDGGRIIGAISRWFWAVGYAIGIGAFLVTNSPMLLLILIFGVLNLRSLLHSPSAGYYAIPAGRRLAMGAAYFGLLAFLALAGWQSERPLAHVAMLPRLEIAAAAILLSLVQQPRRVHIP